MSSTSRQESSLEARKVGALENIGRHLRVLADKEKDPFFDSSQYLFDRLADVRKIEQEMVSPALEAIRDGDGSIGCAEDVALKLRGSNLDLSRVRLIQGAMFAAKWCEASTNIVNDQLMRSLREETPRIGRDGRNHGVSSARAAWTDGNPKPKRDPLDVLKPVIELLQKGKVPVRDSVDGDRSIQSYDVMNLLPTYGISDDAAAVLQTLLIVTGYNEEFRKAVADGVKSRNNRT